MLYHVLKFKIVKQVKMLLINVIFVMKVMLLNIFKIKNQIKVFVLKYLFHKQIVMYMIKKMKFVKYVKMDMILIYKVCVRNQKYQNVKKIKIINNIYGKKMK